MFKFYFLLLPIFFISSYLSATEKPGKHQPEEKKWAIVFKENFRKNGLPNEKYWSFSKRNNAAWGRFLTADPTNTYIKQGRLNLLMTNAGNSDSTANYKSAGISTKGKFSFKYGKVEVKAKFKQATGSWPAIWLMPENDRKWPENGEIDMMEHLNRETKIFHTIHSTANTSTGGSSKSFAQVPFSVDEFNIYGMEWSENEIAFFVNRALTYTYRKPKNATNAEWPFDHPFYLIVNQSGGVGWPGKADPKDFPFSMQVDWVKIYQKK